MNQDNQQFENQPSPVLTSVSSKKPGDSFWDILRFAGLALLIVLPIRWYVAQPFIVSGASMEETFHNNDYLIVDQVSYRFEEPKRGDVIIFRYPRDHSEYFIKRVIGLPGETIAIKGQSVTIWNDEHEQGLMLNEPYALMGEKENDVRRTLGPDEYFVLGDNRDHSSDSRVWGVLRKDEIVGRAVLRLFPPTKIDYLPGDVKNAD